MLMPFRIILRDIAFHFFKIFGCVFPKYSIIAKSVADESEPQTVLSTTVGMSGKMDSNMYG